MLDKLIVFYELPINIIITGSTNNGKTLILIALKLINHKVYRFVVS
jgi:type IV secretory pathway ATPase VirB11/archaellum biosynthesis ATPase